MNLPWLSIVGIGEDGWDGLSGAARGLIESAEFLAGGPRHLALVPDFKGERISWVSPFAANLEKIGGLRGRRICVLASGDPMWFGIGATLARKFPVESFTIIPHHGAFSLAAARMGWALQETICLSVHGRPIEAMALHFHPGAHLLILAEDAKSPARIAALLTSRGYGASAITLLERLGGVREKSRKNIAAHWDVNRGEDLVTLAIEVIADPDTRTLPLIPGLPDDAFIHDGQMTKREVRAATLAALSPWPGALLWDVGAGCGSVAIEWARAGGRAVAIEPENKRRDFIARNAATLGVPELQIVAGRAPEILPDIAGKPDAVFVGGGASAEGVLETAWSALSPGGRMVANAVTAEAEASLFAWRTMRGGELTRLAISRLEPMGRFHRWDALAPITQYRGVKP